QIAGRQLDDKDGGEVGFVFEMYVQYLLRRGDITWEAKYLGIVRGNRVAEYENMNEFTTPANPVVRHFRVCEDLDKFTSHDTLLMPEYRNFASVDFIMTPDQLFQVTLNKDH
ncbi:10518_t:CDS:1, partial [Paraglomus occultum]